MNTDTAASPVALPPTKTVNDLINWTRTTDTYLTKKLQEASTPGTTCKFTRSELAATHLKTCKGRDSWVETLVEKFQKQYGEIDLSTHWDSLISFFQNSEQENIDAITPNPKEPITNSAIQSLLKDVTRVVKFMVATDGPHPRVSPSAPSGTPMAISDNFVYHDQESLLFHVEAKSTASFNSEHADNIMRKVSSIGSCKDFRWPDEPQEFASHEKKIINQVYLQLRYQHNKDNFLKLSAITSYNRTMFILYGGHVNSPDDPTPTLLFSSWFEPKETFPVLLAIIMHERDRRMAETLTTTWGPTAEEDMLDDEKDKAKEVAYELTLHDPGVLFTRPRDDDDPPSDEEGEDDHPGDTSIESVHSEYIATKSRSAKDDPGNAPKRRKRNPTEDHLAQDHLADDINTSMPLKSCPAITYDWHVLGNTGAPLLYTNNHTLLPRVRTDTLISGKTVATASTVGPLGRLPHLVFRCLLGQGVVGIVYRASCSSHDVDVVVKMIEFTTQESWESARLEAEMYKGPLAALQGDVVPHFYGIFSGPRAGLALLVMEDVGLPLTECGLKTTDDTVRDRLDVMKSRLKAVGVCHGDLEARNICRDQAGNLKIIDFSHAYRISVKRKPSNQHNQLRRKILLVSHKKSRMSREVAVQGKGLLE